MARNIRLLIAYDGNGYCGWQRQSNAETIQGTLEKRLTIIAGEPISLQGAGRTDAGVHALGMAANFHTTSSSPVIAFQKGLNSLLPVDIRILAAVEEKMEFHSRFDARGKRYRYDFFTGEVMLPTRRLYMAHIPCRFNLDLVQSCLNIITGTHDFTSFEGAGSRDPGKTKGRGAVRTIYQAQCCSWQEEPDHWSLFLTGDGFLRHMVRNLAGTLFDVGRGKTTVNDFEIILKTRDRRLAGQNAPPCGLFLEKIYYDPVQS
ncbi:MAG: tRNA pseudouridine(38-40) synthase TruA [Desulfobulbaceae bacterium]|nr:tRNA pseudouridine(38-40) synthase TruA [Desulfobulbaceae bacterium]